jgi:hypothetical protein
MSQAFRDPRFEPEIINESSLAKVNEVTEETLLVCEFMKDIGLEPKLLYSNILLS